MNSSSILIISSTSGIAHAVADQYLKQNQNLVLCARNPSELQKQQQELEDKYSVKLPTYIWDITDLKSGAQILPEIFLNHPIKGVIVATGALYDQVDCMGDIEKTMQTISLNFTYTSLAIHQLLKLLKPGPNAFISCISSVAGERGRVSNFTYGASKAGMSTFLEGLRCSPYSKGILIQTVKPGPVDTKMIGHLQKSFLWISPEYAAKVMISSISKRKKVVYIPHYWRYIMFVIRLLPEFILKRVKH